MAVGTVEGELVHDVTPAGQHTPAETQLADRHSRLEPGVQLALTSRFRKQFPVAEMKWLSSQTWQWPESPSQWRHNGWKCKQQNSEAISEAFSLSKPTCPVAFSLSTPTCPVAFSLSTPTCPEAFSLSKPT